MKSRDPARGVCARALIGVVALLACNRGESTPAQDSEAAAASKPAPSEPAPDQASEAQRPSAEQCAEAGALAAGWTREGDRGDTAVPKTRDAIAARVEDHVETQCLELWDRAHIECFLAATESTATSCENEIDLRPPDMRPSEASCVSLREHTRKLMGELSNGSEASRALIEKLSDNAYRECRTTMLTPQLECLLAATDSEASLACSMAQEDLDALNQAVGEDFEDIHEAVNNSQ